MSSQTSFSIVGSGNIAWHLSHALLRVGFSANEIWSRNETTGKELAQELAAVFKPDLDFSRSTSSLIFLCIPDEAIEGLMADFNLPAQVIVATVSGSFQLSLLNSFWHRVAVFYPLQTFSKSRDLDFKNVPLLIEASDSGVLEVVKGFASKLSNHILEVDSVKREKIHMAAVFASNFTNLLLSISKEILNKEQVDLLILKSLVSETMEKAFSIGPKAGQTGPALRGDLKIIQRHLSLLGGQSDHKNIYQILSAQIKNMT